MNVSRRFNLVTVKTSRHRIMQRNMLLHCYMVYCVQDYLYSGIFHCSLYLKIPKIRDLSETWYISAIIHTGAVSLTQVSPNPETQTGSVEPSELRRRFPTFLLEYEQRPRFIVVLFLYVLCFRETRWWTIPKRYVILTHLGRVTQICVFTLQLCKTDDANLRF